MVANLEVSPIGDKLTGSELKLYGKLKREIHDWWKDRLRIGEALREIRDSRLYRQDYETFEAFCVAEFNIKHSQAYRLIEAALVKESIKTFPVGNKLTNERQARALAPVPIEKREEVLKEAASNGKVTAQSIAQAARSNGHAQKPPPQVVDKTGCPIPSGILAEWERAEGFAMTLRQISQIKVAIEKALEDGDRVFAEVTNTTVAHLKNAYGDLKRIVPYAVCTSCQGQTRTKCTLCRGRGFISEFTYSTCVPESTRNLRERRVAT